MLSGSLRQNQRTTNRAFTLIELLVVIAIIAILAAILFPVFAQAREKARQSACLSNEKQLGLATLQYIQDYDETFPLSEYGNFGSCGVQVQWPTILQPYLKNGDSYVDGGYNVRLWVGRGGVFECPNAAQNSDDVPYNQGSIVYSIAPSDTLFISNYGQCDPTSSGYKTGVPVAVLSDSANMVMFGEKGANDSPWNYPWLCTLEWCVHDTGVRDWSKPGRVIDYSRDGTETYDRNDCDYINNNTGSGTYGSCGTSMVFRHSGTPQKRVGGAPNGKTAPKINNPGGINNVIFADGHVKGMKRGQLKFAKNFYDPGLHAIGNDPYNQSWYPY